MRDSLWLLISVTFLISLFANSVQGESGDEKINYGLTGRIVNGTKAAVRQFPHQVSLRRSWSEGHFCAGVIIHENYVLTAAHCMYRGGSEIQPWTILIVAGELRLDKSTSTGQRRGVHKIIIHPQFIYETLQNDIAILHLKVPFKFTAEVNKISLPMTTIIPYTMCQVAGWGYPSEDIRVVNNDLMFVDLPIIEERLCRELLVNVTEYPPGTFCAGYVEGGKDACEGDSGGGMVCKGGLTGIVSGGDGCASPGLPGMYTDVFYYKSWIVKHVKQKKGRSVPDSAGKFDANKTGTVMLVMFTVLSSFVLNPL